MERYILSSYLAGTEVKQGKYTKQSLPFLLQSALETGIITDFEPMIGSYKGTSELSFLIHGANDATICKWLEEFSQECALSLNANRGMGYLYPDGGYVHLGQWNTSRSKPLDREAWSLNMHNGLYLFQA